MSRVARGAQIVVAAVIAFALILRLGQVIWTPDAEVDDAGVLIRCFRFFNYFTVQSNIVMLIAAIFVIRRADLSTPWMRALRLVSLTGISITGIIYALVLAKDDNYTGMREFANVLLHYVNPWGAVLLFLIFGPWPRLSLSDIPRAMVWPAAWVVYTLVHGAITDWWPYGFIDVGDRGIGPVLVSIAMIFLVATALSALYIGLTRLRLKASGEEAVLREEDAGGEQRGVTGGVDSDAGNGSPVG